MKPLDITGQKYGRLTAIKFVGVDTHHYRTWLFRCDCGNEVVKPAFWVKEGNIKSCGCYKIDALRQRKTTHGHCSRNKIPRIYRIWRSMIERCKRHPRYYGRGITVCKEWHSFEHFYEWAMNSGYEDGLSIDRIDNDGNYEPINCRWSTSKEQMNNMSRNHLITCCGITKNYKDWAKEAHINISTIYRWERKGYSDEEIIEHFMKKRGGKK